MELHEKIKYAREKMGWTIERLSDETGIPFPLCWNYERKRTPKLSHLTKIADALHRSIGWFLDGKEADNPPILHCKLSETSGMSE